MLRRRFLTLGPLTAFVACARAKQTKIVTTEGFLTGREQQLLSQVLEVILPPSADEPGAAEVNTAQYIGSYLLDPESDADYRQSILDGLTKFDQFLADQKIGFVGEKLEHQDAVLRDFVEHHGGEHWVSTLLTFTFESLFADPVYGVNTNEVGWKWINHRSGFPRPPRIKWYRGIL